MPSDKYREEAPRSFADELRFAHQGLTKVRGGGYARDKADDLLTWAAESMRALEERIDALESADRDNAHRLAVAARESHELLIRAEEAEGSVSPEALRMQRAQRAAEAQRAVERAVAAGNQRAHGVVQAARRRADEIIQEAQQRAEIMARRIAGQLPGKPEETGNPVVDAQAEAAWMGELRTFIDTHTPALRQRIEETIAGLHQAHQALDGAAAPATGRSRKPAAG